MSEQSQTTQPESRSWSQVARSTQSAAVAGILFAIIMSAVVVLFRLASPLQASASPWLTEESRRTQVSIAIWLVPYAGIFFLWFIGVIRQRLGDREDRLFATVFLGSGLLFVAMLFAGAAVMGGLLVLYSNKVAISVDNIHFATAVSGALLTTFGIRMTAVFTLVVTNLGRRAHIIPRWLTIVGLIAGVALLIAPMGERWLILVFPAWVFVLSVYLLVMARQRNPIVGHPEATA